MPYNLVTDTQPLSKHCHDLTREEKLNFIEVSNLGKAAEAIRNGLDRQMDQSKSKNESVNLTGDQLARITVYVEQPTFENAILLIEEIPQFISFFIDAIPGGIFNRFEHLSEKFELKSKLFNSKILNIESLTTNLEPARIFFYFFRVSRKEKITPTLFAVYQYFFSITAHFELGPVSGSFLANDLTHHFFYNGIRRNRSKKVNMFSIYEWKKFIKTIERVKSRFYPYLQDALEKGSFEDCMNSLSHSLTLGAAGIIVEEYPKSFGPDPTTELIVRVAKIFDVEEALLNIRQLRPFYSAATTFPYRWPE